MRWIREKLISDNNLLVGYRAGMADTITGAGMHNAILVGEVAGKTIIARWKKERKGMPVYKMRYCRSV